MQNCPLRSISTESDQRQFDQHVPLSRSLRKRCHLSKWANLNSLTQVLKIVRFLKRIFSQYSRNHISYFKSRKRSASFQFVNPGSGQLLTPVTFCSHFVERSSSIHISKTVRFTPLLIPSDFQQNLKKSPFQTNYLKGPSLYFLKGSAFRLNSPELFVLFSLPFPGNFGNDQF